VIKTGEAFMVTTLDLMDSTPVVFEGGGWDRFRLTQPERLAAFARADFPAGRLVTLEEVADTACFLLSERADGINGANIYADGAQNHPSAHRFFA
jgi:3-oxoacyl-[acyl-carrier protein] reductase